ncbi:hypothetical protein [Mycoplasma sp. OR1901]|uniref:hypothetical protein n=1 Tax=Mycoplasma sp. OR1901 TaxID=2742195 RepID=UPI0015826B83|nr:hypothetical protein [Mycoplasma sp. OR1901]QKT05499.1 hypothetical protein HTZ87_02165 [Mycoplasma sp. OR1901]
MSKLKNKLIGSFLLVGSAVTAISMYPNSNKNQFQIFETMPDQKVEQFVTLEAAKEFYKNIIKYLSQFITANEEETAKHKLEEELNKTENDTLFTSNQEEWIKKIDSKLDALIQLIHKNSHVKIDALKNISIEKVTKDQIITSYPEIFSNEIKTLTRNGNEVDIKFEHNLNEEVTNEEFKKWISKNSSKKYTSDLKINIDSFLEYTEANNGVQHYINLYESLLTSFNEYSDIITPLKGDYEQDKTKYDEINKSNGIKALELEKLFYKLEESYSDFEEKAISKIFDKLTAMYENNTSEYAVILNDFLSEYKKGIVTNEDKLNNFENIQLFIAAATPIYELFEEIKKVEHVKLKERLNGEVNKLINSINKNDKSDLWSSLINVDKANALYEDYEKHNTLWNKEIKPLFDNTTLTETQRNQLKTYLESTQIDFDKASELASNFRRVFKMSDAKEKLANIQFGDYDRDIQSLKAIRTKSAFQQWKEMNEASKNKIKEFYGNDFLVFDPIDKNKETESNTDTNTNTEENQNPNTGETTNEKTEPKTPETQPETQTEEKSNSWKIWTVVAGLTASLGALVVLFFIKRKKNK